MTVFEFVKSTVLSKQEQRLADLIGSEVRQYVETELSKSRKDMEKVLRNALLEIYKEQERVSQSLLQSGTIPYSAGQTSKFISAVLSGAIRNR